MRAHHALLLVLAVAACGGGDEGGSPDATPLDAPPADAEVPDADPSGPVTITVIGQGNPVPGIDVVFSDASGGVISHQTTDAQGQATETVLPGAAASILVTVPGGVSTRRIGITWLDVVPGDDLVWTFDGAPPTTVGDVSVTLPGVQAGATDYEVMLGCATLGTDNPVLPVTGALTSDCLGSDDNIDVVAVALAADGAPVAYSVDTDVPAVDGGTTTVTLGAWQTAYDPLTFTLTGAPAAVEGAGVETHFFIDGLDFLGPGAGGGFTAGTATMQSGYWQGGVVEQLRYFTFIALGPDPEDGIGVLIGGPADAPATVTHDLSTLLLPAIGSATAADASGRAELAWTAGGSFAAADGALFLSTWSTGADDLQWFVLAPPGVSNPFQLPSMPDDLAAYRSSSTSVFDTPTVIFAEADYVDGYDEFRQVGFGLIGEEAFATVPAGGGLMRASLGGQLPGGP